MKVIIAGSRTITTMSDLEEAIAESRFEITTVLCGLAKGVDILGSKWAQKNNIPIVFYPALWQVHGPLAGMLRNRQMAENAEGLIAVWNGQSRGTEDMIQVAIKRKIPTYLKVVF